MKFTIDGREYKAWELSNEQIVKLLDNGSWDDTEFTFLMKQVYERFKSNLCPCSGEDTDDVFARFFGRYVNGKCHDKKKVAEIMCREHRYLQNEMFLLFMKFVIKLAENCENGYYDPRNKYAAETSKKIIDFFKEVNWPY